MSISSLKLSVITPISMVFCLAYTTSTISGNSFQTNSRLLEDDFKYTGRPLQDYYKTKDYLKVQDHVKIISEFFQKNMLV